MSVDGGMTLKLKFAGFCINMGTTLITIGLGEQSFKHANVLSEKINFSAPGGPESAIFDTDDVDPLYFEVSIVLAPPDPPY